MTKYKTQFVKYLVALARKNEISIFSVQHYYGTWMRIQQDKEILI